MTTETFALTSCSSSLVHKQALAQTLITSQFVPKLSHYVGNMFDEKLVKLCFSRCFMKNMTIFIVFSFFILNFATQY
jgi:hypothetical protein